MLLKSRALVCDVVFTFRNGLTLQRRIVTKKKKKQKNYDYKYVHTLSRNYETTDTIETNERTNKNMCLFIYFVARANKKES